MGLSKINVLLDRDEMTLLTKLSEIECRPPAEQLRYLLRKEGRRRRLFAGENINGSTWREQAAEGGQYARPR